MTRRREPPVRSSAARPAQAETLQRRVAAAMRAQGREARQTPRAALEATALLVAAERAPTRAAAVRAPRAAGAPGRAARVARAAAPRVRSAPRATATATVRKISPASRATAT